MLSTANFWFFWGVQGNRELRDQGLMCAEARSKQPLCSLPKRAFASNGSHSGTVLADVYADYGFYGLHGCTKQNLGVRWLAAT